MNVDQEPLVFRREAFPASLSLLMPTFAFPLAARNLTVPLRRHGMLPYHSLARIQSFGIWFDARLFSAQERSTSELLRTL